MKKLTEDELLKIYGGINVGAALITAGIVVFVIGIIDGFTRPLSCHS